MDEDERQRLENGVLDKSAERAFRSGEVASGG